MAAAGLPAAAAPAAAAAGWGRPSRPVPPAAAAWWRAYGLAAAFWRNIVYFVHSQPFRLQIDDMGIF